MIVRSVLVSAVTAAALAAPAAAAPPQADVPAGAADFAAVTARNGAVAELEAVLDLREATPDAGVPRCLGEASFARTAWAWVPPADAPARVVVSATPLAGSTQTPDLALFPQEPVVRSTADVREPAACDGREALGAGVLEPSGAVDGARNDGSAQVEAVLRAGRPALVQVGWRSGDPDDAVVVSLRREPLPRRDRPAGDDPAGAPAFALGRTVAVPLGGATLGLGDPAQPACPAPATVWRRVDVPAAGVYRVAAGAAARTLTVFSDPLGGDAALACADLADTAELAVTVRAAAAGPLWVRLGSDALDGDPVAQLAADGPYATPDDAADAPPLLPRPGAGGGRGPACVRARAPRIAIAAASLRAVRLGRGRTLSGTVRQPCDARRPRAARVTVAVARRGAPAAARPRAARGVLRWRHRLPRRLAPGRWSVVVRALPAARAPRGARRRGAPRPLATARRSLVVPARPRSAGGRRSAADRPPAADRVPSARPRRPTAR